MNELSKKVQRAIDALRIFEPENEQWWVSGDKTFPSQLIFDGIDWLEV